MLAFESRLCRIFLLTTQIFSRGYFSSFFVKYLFISFQINYIKIEKKSTVDNLWSKVCIYGWIEIRFNWNQKRKRNNNLYFKVCTDKVAEWLRRWTAHPIRSPCVGSHPVSVVFFFWQSKIFPAATYQVFCQRFLHQFPNKLYKDKEKINSSQSLIKVCIYGWIGIRIDWN